MKISYLAAVAISAAALAVTLAGGQAKKAAPSPRARNFFLAALGHPGSAALPPQDRGALPSGVRSVPLDHRHLLRAYALPQTFFLNARHQIVLHVLGPLTIKDLARGVALTDQDRG